VRSDENETIRNRYYGEIVLLVPNFVPNSNRINSAKIVKTSSKLPSDEWDFSNLDDFEVPFAFYYEYSRDSSFIKNAVAKVRKWRQTNKSVPPTWEPTTRLREVIYWLAHQDPYFPNTPWLKIKALAISEIQKEREEARKEEAMINATLPFGQKWCAGKVGGLPGDPVNSIDWMVRKLSYLVPLRIGSSSFSNIWMGSQEQLLAWQTQKLAQVTNFPPGSTFQVEPERSIINGTIDWRATDAEIIKTFADFLNRSRPQQFKDSSKMPSIQQGLDVKFPFRKNAALAWLSVLRQRRSVNTWREYFEIYDLQGFQKIPETIVKSREVSERARPRQADEKKAKLILEWFDKGKPLQKKDFK
jgi:hypothetical protein